MQKTSRLVALSRVARALSLAVVLGLASAPLLAAAEALPAKETAAAKTKSGDELWGERNPPDHYVRSKEPAKGKDPYNWLQMGYAALVMLAVAGGVVLLIRRATRDGAPELGKARVPSSKP